MRWDNEVHRWRGVMSCVEGVGGGEGNKHKRKDLIPRRKRWHKEIQGLKGGAEKRDAGEEMEITR